MVRVIDTIREKAKKIKYNYKLLFHPDKIEIPEELSQQEKDKRERQIYLDKAKLHGKLGAKAFRKFIKKFDKAKFRFIKKVLKEERVIRWSDEAVDKHTKKMLKRSKSESEKKEIIAQAKRSKVLTRRQLKEERSINYYVGVDSRTEQFARYIEKNKNIHQKCLIKNGIILGICVGAGIAGVPVLPFVLGGYQILAGFKNLQCINAQEYYLSRMVANKKGLAKKSITSIKKAYQENPDLIADLKQAKQEGKDLYSVDTIIESMHSKESLEQLRARLLQIKAQQAALVSPEETKHPEQPKTSSKQIVPVEARQEQAQPTKISPVLTGSDIELNAMIQAGLVPSEEQTQVVRKVGK